jgi:hypothetical protein
MMRAFITILLICGASFPLVLAQADWIAVGAAYQCNQSGNTFSLYGTVDTSSPDDAGAIKVRPGFTELKNPANRVQCVIGKTDIELTVNIIPPQPRGTCMGSGLVDLEELKINGVRVFNFRESFNSGCLTEPVLFSIEVDADQILPKLKLCRGKWQWGVGYTDVNCEEKIFR